METQRLIMLTYDPQFPPYIWQYDDRLDVFTNNIEKTIPLPTPRHTNENVIVNISKSDINKKLRSINPTDTLKVTEVVGQLINRFSHEVKDVDKVTVLYHWLTSQDIKSKVFGMTSNFETVNYQLRKLQNKENSYAALFMLLCDLTGIPCVIVKGQVKVSHDKRGRNEAEWNAVLVDGHWRLVDTFWGANLTDTFIPVTYYLFPDPKQFIYSHWAESPGWQLLGQPIGNNTFINQEYLTENFFLMNMEIVSPRGVNLQATDGEIEITFALNDADPTGQEFKCFINNSSQNDTKRMDFVQKREPTNGIQAAMILNAEMRFSEQGKYLVEIVGNASRDDRNQSNSDWVAVYYVNVESPTNKALFHKIGERGWGPNWYLAKCGLQAKSHPYSIIKCDSQEMTIEFQVNDPQSTKHVQLHYRLIEFCREDENIGAQNGEGKRDQNVLNVKINVGGAENSRLTISATIDGDYRDNVCTYYVDTTELMADDRYREMLQELRSACRTRTIKTLKAAIDKVEDSAYQGHRKVATSYNKAKDLHRKLVDYEKNREKIRSIDNNAILKLRNYAHPEQEIISVMKAVLIILGTNPTQLRSWDSLQRDITTLESSERRSMPTRIKKLVIEELSNQTIEAAKHEIEGLDAVASTKSSQDIAPFVKWLESIFEAHGVLTRSNGDNDDYTDDEDYDMN